MRTDSLQLFGLDLGRAWEELRQKAGQSPVLKWLTPDFPVSVLYADGRQALWRDGRQVGEFGKTAQFEAIEVPDALLLHKAIRLPPMPAVEAAKAVELEALSASPFPAADLVWGYRVGVRRKGEQTSMRAVELVLCSRPQVNAYLETQKHRLRHPARANEVWAFASDGMPIVLKGWGELARARRGALYRRIAYALIAISLAIGAAIAVTPTSQLRLRAIEATHAYEDMQRQTGELVVEREAYMRSVEQVDVVRGLLSERAESVRLMETLTRALPDGTYLNNMNVQGLKVTLQGLTPNAATLMQALGTKTGFKEVRAPTAAVRNPAGTADTFVIELQLDPALMSQAAAAADMQKILSDKTAP